MKIKISLSIIIVGFSLIISTLVFASFNHKISNFIIFGDSLSDVRTPETNQDTQGNNFWVKTMGKVGSPLTNIDSQNGLRLLWINFLLLDVSPNQIIHPSRQIAELKLDPYRDNISYAWASAETGKHYVNDTQTGWYSPYNDEACNDFGPGLISENSACVPGVHYQISQYLNDVKNKPNPDTVFFIWAGGNDIFNNMGKLITLSNGIKKPIQFVQEIVKTFTAGITNPRIDFSYPVFNLLNAKDKLIRAGVSENNIYVIDLPDLAKTPAGRKFTRNNPLMLAALTMVTEAYNFNLRLALSYNPLNSHNLPSSRIISAYVALNDIFKNPEQYGFQHLLETCVDDSQLPFCNGYIYFNDKHPTTQWARVFALTVRNQIEA